MRQLFGRKICVGEQSIFQVIEANRPISSRPVDSSRWIDILGFVLLGRKIHGAVGCSIFQQTAEEIDEFGSRPPFASSLVKGCLGFVENFF